MKNNLRRARGLLSLARLVRDPDRLDEVFTLAEAMGSDAVLDTIVDAFMSEPLGRRALVERPRVGPIDLASLGALPEGTLGRAYADHLRANGLDPAAIPTLAAEDARSFVRAHLYETHDIWHAVTGFRTDVAGELGLQAFGLAQFPSRLGAVLIAGGLLHAVIRDFDDSDARMGEIVRGWLMGRRAKKLFGLRWAEMWTRSLDEVRRELDIDLPSLDRVAPHERRAVPALAA